VTAMKVTKRDGSQEPVDLNKILKAIRRHCANLTFVDPMRVAQRTINGLYDGAPTKELDKLSIQTASSLVAEEPEYSRLAARLLSTYIDKEVDNQDIDSFHDSVSQGFELGLINARTLAFVKANKRKLNAAVDATRNDNFEYFGLRTVYDRYLLKNPKTRQVIETPQYFFMRVAAALSATVEETVELYQAFSSFDYMPSTPTLFNSGTIREQLSSCYLLDSPEDDLSAIYEKYKDIALLSKFSGGIGVAYSRVRSRGSLIKGTNGYSNGIVPWLKTLDSSVNSVNQGGKRKGAACVYLEPWHADIEEFLSLRDNTGDEASRTHNLNLANWVPDIFMERVDADGDWSLFDPKAVPQLSETFGTNFRNIYEQAERSGLSARTVKARDLYARMMRTLAETGNGWMTFKDACNIKNNQTNDTPESPLVHSSNLCTEITEVSNSGETAVCNLASVNLSRHIIDGKFDFDKLGQTVKVAVRQLDRVIDINFYPIDSAATSNLKWRPVGLGVMGLQDVFFMLGLPFDSDAAQVLSAQIAEEIYYHALSASCDLAEKFGRHPNFDETRAAKGHLQFDLWGQSKELSERWVALKERIKQHGLRNSLLIAIAPTATIASIVGCYECVEPQTSNLFKRETLSGDFLQVNRYLVTQLKALGLWTEEIRDQIKVGEGSIQGIAVIPETLQKIYRTVWEVSQRSLIDMASARGAYIDQSASLNLFMESPKIGQLSSMYFYAWKKGLKTTYYLRSRPATKIAKATTSTASEPSIEVTPVGDAEAIACSLENPEACEACQ